MSFQSLVTKSGSKLELGTKTALLLDDNEFDRTRIRRLNSKLVTPLILEEVPDINAMNNCLNAQSFDLIMVDYGLGKEDGLSALDMIQRHRKNHDAAKIMISGSNEASIVVSALKRGCSDYVNKRELTAETFQKSVYEALKNARPDAVSSNQSVQEVLRQALLDGELHDVMRQSVRAAMEASGPRQSFSIEAFGENDVLQSLLVGLMDEDDFIFR